MLSLCHEPWFRVKNYWIWISVIVLVCPEVERCMSFVLRFNTVFFGFVFLEKCFFWSLGLRSSLLNIKYIVHHSLIINDLCFLPRVVNVYFNFFLDFLGLLYVRYRNIFDQLGFNVVFRMLCLQFRSSIIPRRLSTIQLRIHDSFHYGSTLCLRITAVFHQLLDHLLLVGTDFFFRRQLCGCQTGNMLDWIRGRLTIFTHRAESARQEWDFFFWHFWLSLHFDDRVSVWFPNHLLQLFSFFPLPVYYVVADWVVRVRYLLPD